jgi:tetratricopeptide (TPR) repeat protein
MDENTKLEEMEITDEFILLQPEMKGDMVAQNLQDLPENGVLLITEDGQKVFGYISKNEIINTLANGLNPLDVKARDIMKRDFIELSGEETLGNLMPKISGKYPNEIVVVDPDGNCIGYFSKSDYEEAMIGLGYYDRDAVPQTPEEWLARGIAMTALGQIEDGLKCYENSLALHIDKERAWFELGKSFEMDKRFKDAILCFDRVVSINSENEEAWINRGNVYSTLRMPDRAVQSYQHAVDLNPKNNDSIINMGLAYCDIGEINEALSCFDRVEKNTGSSASLWYYKGNAFKKGRQYDKAINCYDNAININANHEDSWFNKGAALHMKGNFKSSIECFNEVLNINPYNESAREAIKICENMIKT